MMAFSTGNDDDRKSKCSARDMLHSIGNDIGGIDGIDKWLPRVHQEKCGVADFSLQVRDPSGCRTLLQINKSVDVHDIHSARGKNISVYHLTRYCSPEHWDVCPSRSNDQRAQIGRYGFVQVSLNVHLGHDSSRNMYLPRT